MGSAFGLASTTKQISSAILPQKCSVNGLFLAGHWTTVGSGQGGIPKVALLGRKASYLILKEQGKESTFRSIFYKIFLLINK